jgi:UDP-glucose 4-epimerase
MTQVSQIHEIDGPVLVTGGAGYIGGHTVLALLDQGVETIVIDDLSTGVVCPFHEDTHFYRGTIHDEAFVRGILERHKIKSILHFSGSIKVDESVRNPLKYYYNNTEASRRLIDVACGAGVENFIFSSTAAVYGKTEDKPVDEAFSATPLNPYGWSKLFTERQLKDVCAVNDMRYGIFRYFNVAGADAKGRHGQYMKQPSHLIGRAIDALLEKAPPLVVFGRELPTNDGTGVRDYIHVSDVASAHLALLADMQSKNKSRLMNLGYGNGSSVLEVIKTLEQQLKIQVPYVFGEPREGEAPSVIADISKLKQTLNWLPTYNSLGEITASSYRWASRAEGE